MREHKIVVLGSMAAGKSTLVRTLAQGNVVDTDVANTDEGSAKLATTVAMDYADLDLPNGDRLRLYGTPGQQRFDFIWPILLQGASGVVLLVDAAGADAATQLDAYLDTLKQHAPQVPVVVGLSKVDLNPDFDMQGYHAQLDMRGQVLPVIPFDARDSDQIMLLMDVLMSEIESTSLVNQYG